MLRSGLFLPACMRTQLADRSNGFIAQGVIRANLALVRHLTLRSNVDSLLDTITYPTALTSLDYYFKGPQRSYSARHQIIRGGRLHGAVARP